jgi:hypothetical protein
MIENMKNRSKNPRIFPTVSPLVGCAQSQGAMENKGTQQLPVLHMVRATW